MYEQARAEHNRKNEATFELIATERRGEKPKKTYCKKTMLENSRDPLHWPGISLTPQSGLWVVPLALVIPVVSSCKEFDTTQEKCERK